MRDPSHPKWSHTCRILSVFLVTEACSILTLPTADRKLLSLFRPISLPIRGRVPSPPHAYDTTVTQLKRRSPEADTEGCAYRSFVSAVVRVAGWIRMKTLKVLQCRRVSILIAACAVEKSETPLAPTVAGPIAGVQITPPKPLEPAAGARIPGDRQPLTLLLENASSNSPRPLSYLFEIATEPGFTNRVFAQDNVPPGDGGRTALQLPATLTMGKVYYWRAKALDGANESAYSNPNDFNVYTPVAFDKPALITPINNDKTASQRPNFAFSTAPRQGSPVSVSYVVEISSDSAFAAKVAVWQFNELPGSQQTFASAADLPGGVQLFWHARAFESPVIGPWSDTQVFRTPAPILPTPAPGPGRAPGGSCSSQTQPFNVVKCRRDHSVRTCRRIKSSCSKKRWRAT